jgi:hypothetical protein
MHKTRLFLLDARKPHPPTAFEANGLLAERLRSGLRFHEPLSAKASQGSMTGWFTPILSGPAAASRAGGPCAGADRPAPESPRIPDSPAAFLESWRGLQSRTVLWSSGCFSLFHKRNRENDAWSAAGISHAGEFRSLRGCIGRKISSARSWSVQSAGIAEATCLCPWGQPSCS